MIKKFQIYESTKWWEESKEDPFGEKEWINGEEDWNEPGDIIPQYGDTIICLDDHTTQDRPQQFLQYGVVYVVVDVKHGPGPGYFVTVKGVPNWWSIRRFRFTKKQN